MVVVDSDLRQAVLDALALDPAVCQEAIGVSVKYGTVTLTGRVDSSAKKLAAERTAHRVPGVEAVVDRIVVDIPCAVLRTDEEIAGAAREALKEHAIVPHEKVTVKVEHGWVTLTGNLEWGFLKEAAEKAVRGLNGVQGVNNRITTLANADPASVKKEISRLFHQHAQSDLDHITIESHDGTVELHGTVTSRPEKRDAAKAAWNAPGVSKVENYITISG